MLQVKLAFSLISRICTSRVQGKQKGSGSVVVKCSMINALHLYNTYSDMMITDDFENLHIRVLILILIICFSC